MPDPQTIPVEASDAQAALAKALAKLAKVRKYANLMASVSERHDGGGVSVEDAIRLQAIRDAWAQVARELDLL